MGEKFAYFIIRSFIYLSGVLPKSWVYFFIKQVSLLFYHVSKRRRDITINNLQKAFPEKSIEQIHTLSKDVFIELSKTISEILFMLADKFDIDAAVINKEEVLNVLKKLDETGSKGRIVITAHFSNWELAAHFLAKHGYPMLAVGREGDNTLIDQKLTIPFREKYGNRSVYKKRAAISIMKTLKRGEIVGVLIDQKVDSKEGVKVKFFDRDVYTTSIVATMQEKLDIMILPIFLPRVGDGKYKMIIGDPVERSGNVADMTQSYNDVMEKVIREYPAQWFWMHNRWKV